MGYTAVAALVISVLAPIEKRVVKAALLAKQPWLKLPVINKLFNAFVDMVIDEQFESLDEAALSVYIRKYKNEASEEFKKAVDEFEGAQNEEQSAAAKKKVIDSMRKLGKFTPP